MSQSKAKDLKGKRNPVLLLQSGIVVVNIWRDMPPVSAMKNEKEAISTRLGVQRNVITFR